MKDQLVFDTTSAQSIADSDAVGAYVRSSDGTLIDHATINTVERLAVDATLKDGAGTALTSTLVGADQALDVNVVSGINVEVDLSHIDDSVRLGDGTNFLTSTTVGPDIGLDVNVINASLEVTQGTSPWVIGDGGGSITVDATDLDIRDLTAVSDSVQAWAHDGAGTAITSTVVGPDTALDVNVVNSTSNDEALADTAIANAAKTLAVAGTGEAVVTAALADRKYLWIYNNAITRIFIGASGVTTANGFPVAPRSYIELRAGASVAPHFVGQALATPQIRTLELS